jgi:phage terminase Nu1 subunit (DNA packaging protein)
MFNELNGIQLGQAIGKDRRTVTRWTKAGMPRNKDKTYCLPKVVEWLLEREKESALSDQAMAGAGDSPALERYRLARAAMAEMDLKIKEGELIHVNEVHRAWALRVAEVAAGLETLADRLPPIMVGKTREEMQQVIRDEVWRLRDSYARGGQYCETIKEESQ